MTQKHNEKNINRLKKIYHRRKVLKKTNYTNGII